MVPMPAPWQESDEDDFDTPCSSAVEDGFDTAGEYSSQALQGIGSGSIAPLGTAHFVHVYRTFCSYLPHILIMFNAHFVRIYRTF